MEIQGEGRTEALAHLRFKGTAACLAAALAGLSFAVTAFLALSSEPGGKVDPEKSLRGAEEAALTPAGRVRQITRRQGRGRPSERLARPGIAFEPGVGQTARQAKFVAHGAGYAVLLSGNEIALSLAGRPSSVVRGQLVQQGDLAPRGWRKLPPALLGWPVSFSPESRTQSSDFSPASSLQSHAQSFVHLTLVGANPNAKVIGLDRLTAKSNYFVGNDPKKWRTNVPNYAKVMVKGVYPGVDQIFYGKEGQLEYDFVVHPGADPNQIKLAVGAGLAPPIRARQAVPLRVNANGDIVIATDAGEVRLGKPVVYQENSRQLSVVSGQLKGTKDKGRKTTDVLSSSFIIQPEFPFSILGQPIAYA